MISNSFFQFLSPAILLRLHGTYINLTKLAEGQGLYFPRTATKFPLLVEMLRLATLFQSRIRSRRPRLGFPTSPYIMHTAYSHSLSAETNTLLDRHSFYDQIFFGFESSILEGVGRPSSNASPHPKCLKGLVTNYFSLLNLIFW